MKTIICSVCGVEKKTYSKTRKYCSLSCRNEGYKGISFSKKTQFKKGTSGAANYFFGKKHTYESRKKISESRKGIIPANKGKFHSEFTKKHLSDVHKKIWQDAEYVRHFKEKRALQKMPCGSSHWLWRGGDVGYRGPGWEKKACASRERDCYKCVSCGISKIEHQKVFGGNLHVHHIIPYYISKSNALENLVTLCRSCHAFAEWKIRNMGVLPY